MIYTVLVDSINGPYYTVGGGITGVISSGITHDDRGVITIVSGTYSEKPNIDHPSGVITFYGIGDTNPVVEGLNIINSGNIESNYLNINDLNITGSGNFFYRGSNIISGTIKNSPVTTFEDSSLQFLSVENGDVNFYNTNCSGIYDWISASGIGKISFISGNYGHMYHTDHSKITVSGCNTFTAENIYGTDYSGGYPIQISGCASGFELNHCSFVNLNSGVLRTHDASGDILYTILAASGGSNPVSGTSSVIICSGSFITNYNNFSPTYLEVSGQYNTLDPLFTNINDYDLRINANSPAACAADYINPIQEIDPTAVESTVTPEAIKFYVLGEDYRAITPSSVYVVQDGKAIYFQADPEIDDNMDVFITNKYTIEDNIKTIQSLSNSKSSNHKYGKDYELIQILNYNKNENETYAKPFTILPLNDIVTDSNDMVIEGVASGTFQNFGFTRDHGITSDGKSFYWVCEKNNQYLHKYSSTTNEILDTYPLFKPINASGYGTVSLNNEFYKFINYEKDGNREVRGLLNYKDYLYIVTKTKIEEENDTSYSTDLYIYNKYERFPFETPENIISGIPGIIENNATDITIDDQNDVYISSSGIISKYKQYFDYALITREKGSIQTNVTFREDYLGVDL